jgi:hypothetical protein
LADTPGGAGEGIPEANGQKVHEDEDYLFLAFAEAIFWTMKGYLLTIKLAFLARNSRMPHVGRPGILYHDL